MMEIQNCTASSFKAKTSSLWPQKLDEAAFWLLALGAGLSAFRPVAHYAPWGIALLLVLVQRVLWRVPLTPRFSPGGRRLFLFVCLLTVWCAIGPALGTPETPVGEWVHGWSFFLDFLVGTWLSARLCGSLDRQQKLRWVLFAGFLVISAVYCTRPLFFRDGYMNNGDDLGYWGLLISLVVYDRGLDVLGWKLAGFWKRAGQVLFSAACCIVGTGVTFLSFSLGAWGIAAIQAGILLLLSRLPWKKVLDAFIALSLVAALWTVILQMPRFHDIAEMSHLEVVQATALKDNNARNFTSGRSTIWRVTSELVRQKPWTGRANNFASEYSRLANEMTKQFHFLPKDLTATYSHNLYLDLLYRGGVPALLIFAFFIGGSIWLAWSILKKSPGNRWAIMIFAFTTSQLAFSLVNSFFQFRRDMGCVTWVIFGVLTVLRSGEAEPEQPPAIGEKELSE
ncbi:MULTISPECIES: O-antigen ligase family protein [Jonquetella]|uniref:Lipid A core-O-antigen ligase-like enyme n=1 Tax=Jonquetella anthropi DSM 22815 TaxID=885272 RepID=H0UJ26_9BACT|nr:MULTISPECIES: O-antigen ligase family protein [Jonquetella]EHM13853.1 lipid A core-O-antigen ligase-like enyme [Jonquetella anthropi DSM 22815]ERL23753.1 O-antigen ligase [Jonquetella sp. BV3C21]